jgi:hypothetical protein
MPDLQPASATAQEPQEDNMALPTTETHASLSQPYKNCIQVAQEDLLGSSRTRSTAEAFPSVSLPLSHPVFSAGTVEILAPFSIRRGGIPLRTFPSNDIITFVAHASGVDLYAE